MDSPTLPLRARLARIAPYFVDCKRGFALMVIGALIGAATEPLVPALMKPLFDRGFSGPGFPLWMVPVVIISIFLIRGMASFMAQYGLAWAANRGTEVMRAAMFERLNTVHPEVFRTNSASALISTITYETQGGASMLVGSVLTLVRDALTLLALLGYLLYLNWQLTLFVGILFPAIAFAMRKLSKRLHRLTVENQNATHQLAYVVEENVLAWRIVRLHAAAKSQIRRFAQGSLILRRLSMKSSMASATMTPITQLIAACGLSAVIVLALWQSRTDGASAGEFMAFITAMLLLLSPMKHLSEVAGPITRGLASLERGISLINETPIEQSGPYAPERAVGEIRFQRVSLSYPTAQSPALDEVSFHVRKGETVALVGPSGSGKSTLVNLLPRFLTPSSGEVFLDGHPLAEWDVNQLRSQFALVSQDVILFNDSVAANVALGAVQASDVDESRVREALRAANLMTFVETLPDDIRTLIGHNGSHLSGGQRQRLAIARAIYKNAPILILDEATSALDSESERLVQEALDRLMNGRTSLVIAHRLATIQQADRVLVLDAGKIVEQGTHAELLAQGGLFAHLHALQFKTAH